MTILQIALLVVLLLVLYVLLVPIKVSVKVDDARLARARIKIFPFAFQIDDRQEKKKKKKKKGKKKRKEKEAKSRFDFVRFMSHEYQTGKQIISAVSRFVVSLFRSKHHYLNISLRGGLGAPDLTGMAFGLIEAARPVLGRRVTIAYQPDFMAESVRGAVCAETVIRTYVILGQWLVLLARLPIIRIVIIFKNIAKGAYDVRKT